MAAKALMIATTVLLVLSTGDAEARCRNGRCLWRGHHRVHASLQSAHHLSRHVLRHASIRYGRHRHRRTRIDAGAGESPDGSPPLPPRKEVMPPDIVAPDVSPRSIIVVAGGGAREVPVQVPAEKVDVQPYRSRWEDGSVVPSPGLEEVISSPDPQEQARRTQDREWMKKVLLASLGLGAGGLMLLLLVMGAMKRSG